MKKSAFFLLLLILLLIPAADAAANCMTMITYRRLQTVEELIADQKYEEAESKLNDMLEGLPPRPDDQAYIHYTAGMFYLQQENIPKTKNCLCAARKLNCLPAKTTLYLLQTLAGISMQEDRFEDAVNYFQSCFDLTPEPDKDIYIGMGTACFYCKKYKDTIIILEKARNLFEPKEPLYLMLFSAYYELKQLKNASKTLETMIRLWPDKEKYWLQLASLYIEQKKYEKSLEIMQSAWARGYLKKEPEVLQYVYTLYEEHLPYKAACSLKDAMGREIVAENRKNLELLSTMYQEAREREKAIMALKDAAACSDDGKNDLYIAQLYFEMENAFDEVIKHAKAAIEKGIKQEGNAFMLIAVSYTELGKTKEAKKYLQRALQFQETKTAAEQWLASFE